jgi:hypothetical protein
MVSLTIRRLSMAVPLSALFAAGLGFSGATGFVEKTILVTVLDKTGAPIKDLTAAEFVVTEDGKRREVTGAELATERLFVSVIVDTSKPPDGDVDRSRDVRTSVAGFVKAIHAVSPSAEIALRSAGGAVSLLQHSTNKTADLEQATGRLVPDLSQATVVIEALSEAARELAETPSPRRAIVTLDFATREDSSVEPSSVVGDMFRAGASVWAVSVQGPRGRNSTIRDSMMNHLTRVTGGVRTTALVPTALESILTNLAACLTSQYVVTYMRPDGSVPKSIAPSARRGSKFLISTYVQ